MFDIQSGLIDATFVCFTILLLCEYSSFVRKYVVKTYTLCFGAAFAKFVDSKLLFIGVIHHELAHILFACLTGAKIKNFRLFKLMSSRDNNLGYVDIITRGPALIRQIQSSAVGLAPVICGSITLYMIYSICLSRGVIDVYSILLLILSLIISYHMSPSEQDLSVASSGLILMISLLVLIFSFFRLERDVYIGFFLVILFILSVNLVLTFIISSIRLIVNGRR